MYCRSVVNGSKPGRLLITANPLKADERYLEFRLAMSVLLSRVSSIPSSVELPQLAPYFILF